MNRDERFDCHFPVLWDKADPPTIGYFAHYFSIEIDEEIGEGRICLEFLNEEFAIFKIWPDKNQMNRINSGGMVDIAYCFRRRALWTRRFEPQVQIVGKRYSSTPKTIKCPNCETGRYNLKLEYCRKCGCRT